MTTHCWQYRYEDDLYVRDHDGNRNLPPLVLLHGWGDSGNSFDQLLDELLKDPHTKDRRFLVPDLPGYGRSREVLAPDMLDGMADRIAGWLCERGEKSVTLIGHSMSGVVAMLLAERHPQLVAGVIDIEGNKTGEDCTFSILAKRKTLVDFLESGYAEMLRHILYSQIPGKGCRGYEDPAYLRYFRNLSQCDPQALHAHANDLVNLSYEGNLAERLADLRCPVYFVSGTPWGTGNLSLQMVKDEEIPLVSIHPAGHWPFIDQPHRCARVVVNALTHFSKVSH